MLARADLFAACRDSAPECDTAVPDTRHVTHDRAPSEIDEHRYRMSPKQQRKRGGKVPGGAKPKSRPDRHSRAGGGIVPNVDVSPVPGASGMGDIPASPGSFNLNTSTGSTSTTSGDGGGISGVLGDLLPIASIAAHFLPAAATAGRVGHHGGGARSADGTADAAGRVKPRGKGKPR